MYSGETIETAAGRCLVRRSNRRTLAISVLPDGRIELRAPHDAPHEAIASRVAKRLRWIVIQRRNFVEMNRGRAPSVFVGGATHRYLGRQYRLKIARAEPIGVKLIGAYFRVTVRKGDPKEVGELLARWFRQRAIEQFSARLAAWRRWCADRRLPVPQLRLLRMPKRWGSAHSDGRIYLNPDLVKAPSICINYVILHEVCHLRHSKHDRAFFRLLERLEPDWRSIKARLEKVEI